MTQLFASFSSSISKYYKYERMVDSRFLNYIVSTNFPYTFQKSNQHKNILLNRYSRTVYSVITVCHEKPEYLVCLQVNIRCFTKSFSHRDDLVSRKININSRIEKIRSLVSAKASFAINLFCVIRNNLVLFHCILLVHPSASRGLRSNGIIGKGTESRHPTCKFI